MGGEGSMASAIVSLRQNRALLKKRKFKDIRELLYQSSGKTKMEFKTVSAQELFHIKQAIRKRRKRHAQLQVVIYTVSFTLAGGLVFYLHWWLTS